MLALALLKRGGLCLQFAYHLISNNINWELFVQDDLSALLKMCAFYLPFCVFAK